MMNNMDATRYGFQGIIQNAFTRETHHSEIYVTLEAAKKYLLYYWDTVPRRSHCVCWIVKPSGKTLVLTHDHGITRWERGGL